MSGADRWTPALYPCVVSHAREEPLRRSFRQRTYLWLVDVDRLPRLPAPLRPLARFDPRDHFAGTAPTLRAGVERFLSAHGVELEGGTVLMLAAARSLGFVFNPLTLFWCHRPDGRLECVLAEVHNTYGERHCYLLRPSADGSVGVPKDFYVSPFFPVDGAYRMRLPEPDSRLRLHIRLERDGGCPFAAAVHGVRRAATPRNLLRLAARHPSPGAAVAAGIRRHGVALWLRGLPVRSRPHHPEQRGVF